MSPALNCSETRGGGGGLSGPELQREGGGADRPGTAATAREPVQLSGEISCDVRY